VPDFGFWRGASASPETPVEIGHFAFAHARRPLDHDDDGDNAEVADWNGNMWTAFLEANVSPLVASRHAALVSAAVCDAVNGIERRYGFASRTSLVTSATS